MLAKIPLVARPLDGYRTLGGSELTENIERLAAPVRGVRVLHLSLLNAQPGLSHTVESLASLMLSVGVEAEWRVVLHDGRRTAVDRALNRALDGHFVGWTAAMADLWLDHGRELAQPSLGEYDFVVVHGVELAGAIVDGKSAREAGVAKWIWQCHADISRVQLDIFDFLMLYTRGYDHKMGCCADSSDARPGDRYSIVPPTIDPLSPGNRDVPQAFVQKVLAQHGLDPNRPVVLFVGQDGQVDGGAIDGFRWAKARNPALQLLRYVVGDPNESIVAPRWAHRDADTMRRDDERVVHVVAQMGTLEANMLQHSAMAVMANADDHVAAPTVLEAMWKGRAAIVGEAMASWLGLQDGQNGFVASNPEGYAHRVLQLLESPRRAASVGEAGREHVRKHFLVTRLLQTYLDTLGSLAGKQPVSRGLARRPPRGHLRTDLSAATAAAVPCPGWI